jgi:hypothetical protein
MSFLTLFLLFLSSSLFAKIIGLNQKILMTYHNFIDYFSSKIDSLS